MSKNSTMNAKNDTKNEKKKGVNFFFILVEFVLCSFLIASVSMKMILPAILSAFLAVFITPFPDIVLEKMGERTNEQEYPLRRRCDWICSFMLRRS